VGDLGVTLGTLTLSGAGAALIGGVSTPALAPLTTTTSGVVAIGGSLTQTLGAVTISAAGSGPSVAITGQLTETLGDVHLSASGTAVSIQPAYTGAVHLTGPQRRFRLVLIRTDKNAA
jgi:hypothetical protein